MLDYEALLGEFVNEGMAHVQKIEKGLLDAERGLQDTEQINAIFRSAHSIKGTAGFFGLQKMVELSHAMEALLATIRNTRKSMDTVMIDALLSATDKLKEMLENVKDSESADIDAHVAQLTDSLRNEQRPVLPSGSKLAGCEKCVLSEIPDTYKETIRDAKKRGQKVYRLVINLQDCSEENNARPDLISKIRSIGNVICCDEDRNEVACLFTTVLEPDLVDLALDVCEADIQQISDAAQQTEAFDIFTNPSVSRCSLEATPQPANVENGVILTSVGTDKKEDERIRVDVALLDSLVNLGSEIVLGRNQLFRRLEKYAATIPGLTASLQHIDRLTTELQEKIMRTRMQPVANVFDKLPRLVRDLGKSTGKNVQLLMEGKDIELDKSIIEALADPLVHLIRNAVDHGVEPLEERKNTGKSLTALISVKAHREGGRAVISVSDDGAGVNLERVAKKALQQNILTQGQLALMGEQERLNLLFHPGFSTSKQITDISGRGVGLDIAKSNIEKLGGNIEVGSVWGKGTTFRLRLPLTLVVVPSLIVEAANQQFVLPQVNLREIVRIIPGDKIQKIEYINGYRVLNLRGELLPIVNLAESLGRTTCNIVECNITRVLIVRSEDKVFGLTVDRIYDREDVLVKPVPRYIKECKVYSGVTILGDGKVAMVLDPDSLAPAPVSMVAERQNEKSTYSGKNSSTTMAEQQEFLLFKCSGPENFGINLPLVARVDEIEPGQVQLIGDKEYVNYEGTILRIIRPEDYLPVKKLTSRRSKLCLIIPKLVKYPIGIVVEKIQDTVQIAIDVNEEDIKAKGLWGSAVINDKIVLIVNLYGLMELADPERYSAEQDTSQLSRRHTVLLVEDTAFFASVVRQYLEGSGYHVLLAGNGEEALNLIGQHAVDVVVSDINMPVMDGVELVKAIRGSKNTISLPVIALTSLANERLEREGLEAGFNDYELKLDKTNLLKKVALALSEREGRLA
ncbi:hybrid sensor histidine kinase/response regulator [Sporomusa sp.]|uniref:hybrid sensor histidine kinase/response regulator n=1 Tax=Sporomusa sp. TaxID=2078658 RepID=UPI002BAB4250|nr:chemotaxis protein CheW [Sporomusa sp.]HWR42621.1 chemotaxis protein CheW [Sporomusa sp.]